ncbi:ABC transporter permease [Rhodanobacter sp. B04]|uniref:ABC transporter permease n=1 Tax=Rhodanobacter sp. B04 TaxID=1945860 RepID=UPI0009860CD6|nr:FtsX-like permease family protein [Rhodanobacter sp. B04]OOG66136.1 ABC transporter permease [Rhodanobacter sp. B04]
MQWRPILSSLRHHKLTALLLMLQVALTCAIVCNVVFMIVNRVEQVSLPSGVDEAGLSMLVSETIDKHENKRARHAADLAGLSKIPGVTAAVAVDTLPLGRDESSYGTCASAEDMATAIAAHSMMRGGLCVQPAVYGGTPGELGVLGLHLAAGRDFRTDEYVAGADEHVAGADVPVAILSRALAERLYPGKNALGQSIYTGGSKPIRVIGIVDTLLRPQLREAGVNQYAMLFPMLPNDGEVTYLLRSAPQDRERVLRMAAAKLEQLSPERIIPAGGMRTYTQMREAYFQRDTTMIGLLLASGLGLLFVTALGITGLANFWVQQRRRSIGIRRAIGASRGDILRYFQTENFLIVSGGIALGLLLAIMLNLVLMKHYELPRLPLYYLPIGALALWLLGQLAVLGPALRAAAVPPVVATRSV